MQYRWYRQKKLTEDNFVVFQVIIWGFVILTSGLAISFTLEGIIISGLLFISWITIGFPLGRWFFRKFLANKL
jgi:hypothetical protein